MFYVFLHAFRLGVFPLTPFLRENRQIPVFSRPLRLTPGPRFVFRTGKLCCSCPEQAALRPLLNTLGRCMTKTCHTFIQCVPNLFRSQKDAKILSGMSNHRKVFGRQKKKAIQTQKFNVVLLPKPHIGPSTPTLVSICPVLVI